MSARDAETEITTLFSIAFEHSPIGVALVSPDGRWLKVNRALCELFGYSEQEFLTRTILDLTHPDDIEVTRDRVRRVIAGEVRSLQLEKRYIHRRGDVIAALSSISLVRDAQDQPRYFVAQIQDITERKRAEDDLRAINQKFHLLADHITDAFWIRSADMRELHYVSPAFERIWGRPVATLHENPGKWTDFIVPADRDRVVTSFSGLTRDTPSLDIEYRILRPDGEVRWIRARGFQVRDGDGTLIRTTGIVTDITERRQSEEDLRQSQSALRQAQKMEAVGQLAAGVAHEFNNLLQALMSMSTILRLRAAAPEITEIGADMESLIKRGAGLTQQLLLFSHDRIIEKSALDLDDQIQKASALLRRLIPETITILVETSGERLNVQGDAGQIQQVLLNLAINSRDAMMDGGSLTLRTGRDGDELFFEVEDTGHGMDEATQAHLFEPFFTTKEQGKGTGLGLAVAHGIVKQHGGHIEVHSRPGQGSRFRVMLLPSREEGLTAPKPAAEPGLPAGSGRVLVVEDEPSVRAGITTLLELIGYEVISAGSAEDAMALDLDPPPRLLLSDITLPGMTGPALVERMRDRWPALKVVLMSGYLEERLRENARRDRWRFLQKPFEFADLARELDIAMNEDVMSVNPQNRISGPVVH